MADFFDKPEVVETQAEPEVFKLGEKEYSQEELQKLVGLGEMAKEAEEKWNTPINKVFPEYTKATQKLKEYEAKEAEKLNPAPQVETPSQLTDQQKEEARNLLKGLGFLTKEEAEVQADARVNAQLAARDLLKDVDGVLDKAKDAGNPATTPQELLNHMQETGIKDPGKAYKDLFEKELDEIKEKKLASIKGNGMVTTEASTAGSKQPAPLKVTRQNLGQIVAEALGGAN